MALAEGEQALAIWQQIPELHASYVFRWTALLPLMAALHATHQPDAAVQQARELLKPGQMRLPDELEGAVRDTIAAWDHREAERATAAMEQALTLAQELGFL